MKPLACAVVIVVSLLGLRANADTIFRLSICDERTTHPHASWIQSSAKKVAKTFALGRAPFELHVRRATCNPSMPDTTCAALPGALFCRQNSFDRINLAASWYVETYFNNNSPPYDTFNQHHSTAVISAFKYADNILNGSSPSRIALTLRDYVENGELTSDAHTVNIERLETIHARIVSFNFAALIGHEVHHVHNNICPITEKSDNEENGIFDHILEYQTSNQLFETSYPDPHEINADRCAMRQLNLLRQNKLADQQDEQFARRVAADMVAFQALTGFRRFDQLPEGQYPFLDLDQYLRPAFRLALLTSAISDQSNKPPICGEASSLFVRGVQVGFQESPGNGQVSDKLLSLFPEALEKSWNGAPWTAASFSCH